MSTVATEAVLPLAKRTVGEFVSQGSAGGAISLFLLTLIGVLKEANVYAFLIILYFFLIGLWTVFVVCLLLDRRFFPRPEKSAHEANPLANKGT